MLGGLAKHVHFRLVRDLLNCVAAVASEAESAAPIPSILIVPHAFVVLLCSSTGAHLVDRVVLENVSALHFSLPQSKQKTFWQTWLASQPS